MKRINVHALKEKLRGVLCTKQRLAEYFFAAIIIYMGIYRLGELTMPIILDDEFGYWSNSMLFSGQDWTDLTGRINYYSYGYSFILCLAEKIALFRGYGWMDLYKVAVVFNIIFVTAGYFLSVRIANRYMKHMNRIMTAAVCFVAAVYPSNMIYTHVTLTECTLSFLFWVFAFLMMRAIDKPGIGNHIGLAGVAVYMYSVHQRTIGLIITAVIIVLVLRLLRINSLKQTIFFLGSVYIFFLMHSMLKMYVKNVNYLNNPVQGMREIFSAVFTKPVLALLVAVIAASIWLYILDKGKLKLSLVLLAVAAAAVIGAALKGAGLAAAPGSDREVRLAVNELSGQIDVLKRVFTKYGMIRLGTSIVGKWYYLAAATGLVICWGLRDLFLNALFLLVDGVRRFVNALRGKAHVVSARMGQDFRAHIFLLGMFLSFASAFMICALYKEGFFKVDDLINGRYIEYLIGFALVYSVNRMLSDKHWFIFWLVCFGAYIAAGAYCQYAFDTIKRTEYELIHATVFGRVFWNYESPTGKIKEVARYVVPLATGFVLLGRAAMSKMKYSWLVTLRILLALMLPVAAWNHIYTEIVDNYVVVRNEKQSGAAPQVAEWINRLSDGGPVYFVKDGMSNRQAEILQYMCGYEKIVLTEFGSTDFTQDAVFILNVNALEDDIIKENCEVADTKASYAVVVNKHQRKMEYLQRYRESISSAPVEMEYIEYEEDAG